MRVTLLERGDRLLPGFQPALSTYVLTTLRSRGVDVQLGIDVVEVDGDGVTISGGQRIPAATVVWAGGALTCACPAIPIPSRSATWPLSPHPPPVACARSWPRSPSRPAVTPGARSGGSHLIIFEVVDDGNREKVVVSVLYSRTGERVAIGR